MTNPPLDFQQNPVEFVMDALRVARALQQNPRDDTRSYVSMEIQRHAPNELEIDEACGIERDPHEKGN